MIVTTSSILKGIFIVITCKLWNVITNYFFIFISMAGRYKINPKIIIA